VRAQFHVADGQTFPEDAITLMSGDGEQQIPDTLGLWDGTSVASAGGSRATNGELWDIHTFDVTSIFTAVGAHDLALDGQNPGAADDCLGLVLVVIDLPRGSAPRCGDGLLFFPEECDDGNTADGDCCSSTCTFEPAGTVCANSADLCQVSVCDGAGYCDPEYGGCRIPVAPGAARLLLRDAENDVKDRLAWRWTTGSTTAAELGNPLETTDYALCVFDRGTGPSARPRGRARRRHVGAARAGRRRAPASGTRTTRPRSGAS
jgi:cysteine-rich repeat protein